MVPGATPAMAVIGRPSPGNVPLKPVSSTPASISEPSSKTGTSKTGTSIVKAAPPKETARITVKPNLPAAAVRVAGNFPIAKPAAGGLPVVAAAVAAKAVAKPAFASSKPATTIVKTGAAKVASATVKPAAKTAAPAPAVAVTSTQFQEEGSTTLTTVLAGVLAVLTWGTAGVLIASYLAWI